MIEKIRKKSIVPMFVLLTAAFVLQILHFIHKAGGSIFLNAISLPTSIVFSVWFMAAVYYNLLEERGVRNKFNYFSSLSMIYITLSAALLYGLHAFIPQIRTLPFPMVSFGYQGIVMGVGLFLGALVYAVTYRRIVNYVKRMGRQPPKSKVLAAFSALSVLSVLHSCIAFFFKEAETLIVKQPSFWVTSTLLFISSSLFIYMVAHNRGSKPPPPPSDTDNENANLSFTSTTIPSELYQTVKMTFDRHSSRDRASVTPSENGNSTPKNGKKAFKVVPSKNDPRYWTDKGMVEPGKDIQQIPEESAQTNVDNPSLK